MAKLEIFLSCHKCNDSFVNGSGCTDELMSLLAYYQIQGQMAVTGIKKCYFAEYICKGIFAIEIDFDPFGANAEKKLFMFYVNGLVLLLKGGKVNS